MISAWVKLPKNDLVTIFLNPKNQSFKNLNNLYISFLNLFISLIKLKTLLNNLFNSYLNLPIYFFIPIMPEHLPNIKNVKFSIKLILIPNIMKYHC